MTKYLNIDAIVLENDQLIVHILPNLGGKVASIKSKKTDYEYIFQASKKAYDFPDYAASFEKYDTSGIDDCIPTIDACIDPISKSELPDHGDVWSLAWEIVNKTDHSLDLKVSLRSLPLVFHKTISLNETSLHFSYQLDNDTDQNYAYLWAFHGLLNYETNSFLEFEDGLENYINVQNDELWNFDIRQLNNFKENHTYKYYFQDPIREGWARLTHPDQKTALEILFNPKDNPYLGVWLTTGGFKGEKNIAIEPCNGYYDALDRAIRNEKYQTISAKSQKTWQLELKIKEL